MARSNAASRYGPSPNRMEGVAADLVRLRLVGPNRQCRLKCYPTDDPQFEADAAKALADVLKPNLSWGQLLQEVRSRMMRIYPAVAIRPRDPIAADNDPNELWYCFRDGGVFRT
jgi:hypothetical protein